MQFVWRCVWAIGLLGWLTTCGATPPAVPPLPSQGGPAWVELNSEHFTVWTDASPEQGRKLVKTMERLRKVVLGVSFFGSDSPARSFVIAFRNMEEVHAYVPPQFIAMAHSPRNALGQPVIVLSVSSLENDMRIVTHELTHVISHNVIPEQPAWLSEGLATYFETVRIDEASGKVEVGRPVDWRFAQIRREGLLPTSQLFACEEHACMSDRFYATAWALMTYLVNEHPHELVRYLERLIATPSAEQSKLWAAVFPSLPPVSLDRALAQWVAYGKIQINSYNAVFTDAPSTQRALTDADAHAARGLLRYLSRSTGVPTEISDALALDATAVLPNLIHAAVSKAMDADRARAVVTAHPDDWRAWFLVGFATSGTPDSHAAVVKMCALLVKNPAVLPPQTCAPERLDPTKDPRRVVWKAAEPRVNACFARAKGPIKPEFLEMEISASGAVTSARASVGSPEVNACIEDVLRSLSFPPGYPGPYRITSK